MTSTIELRNVSKIFKIYDRPVDLMWETLLGRARHRNFEALKDINLSIEKGSVVGLIGRNGAGKSTLLRIIARTLQQTSGDVRVDGRISAILELGTGFNPDYTGRENIYLGGLCLGLTRQEVRTREAEIIAFSELEEFIDQPFKTYSSGMQARLTFSVAVSVDPDILIVDEALSVGDAKFQLKSFDRIAGFKRAGKTVFIVSHDINTLAAFCDRAILLERGCICADGAPKTIGRIYHEMLFGESEKISIPATSDAREMTDVKPVSQGGGDSEHRYGNGALNISEISILDSANKVTTLIEMFGFYKFHVVVDVQRDIDDFVLGILIRTPKGIEVVGTDSAASVSERFPGRRLAGNRYSFDVNFRNNLAPGEFFLTCGLANSDGTKLDFRFDCLSFRVVGGRELYANSLVGLEFSFVPGK